MGILGNTRSYLGLWEPSLPPRLQRSARVRRAVIPAKLVSTPLGERQTRCIICATVRNSFHLLFFIFLAES